MANILLADDSLFMRRKLVEILEPHGHTIVGEAIDGRDAVEKYKQLKPDVVILDMTMPEMGGIDALKEIKAIDPKARVIMCSAMGQQAMMKKAVEAGAKDFVVKPLEEEKLMRAVNRIMDRIKPAAQSPGQ